MRPTGSPRSRSRGSSAASTSVCSTRTPSAAPTRLLVLIHVGFAMSKVDEHQARATLKLLEELRPPRGDGGQPHERRRGQDPPARARARRSGGGGRAGRGARRRRARLLDADRLSLLHVPVVQLNTDGGFGGRVPPRREHGPLGDSGRAARRDRSPGDRERREPGVPGGAPRRRGRPHEVCSVTEGEDQAPEVPAHVPSLRAGYRQQIDLLEHLDFDVGHLEANLDAVHAGVERMRVSARTGEGVGAVSDWLVRVTARAGAHA